MEKDMCFIFFFYLITPGQTQVKVTVKEDSDAVLPCSLRTKENIETSVFDWKKDGQNVFFYNGGHYYGQGISGQDKQFEGGVSHFNEELKNGLHKDQEDQDGRQWSLHLYSSSSAASSAVHH